MEEMKNELAEADDEKQEVTQAIQGEVEEIDPTENVLRRHIVEDPRKKMLAKHRLWLDSLQHEYPMPYLPFKIGVYIRYYNQTRHKNYLEKHIAQFRDDIALCRNWTLVDFYVDKGMTAPRMENSKEWCRLLGDCFSGKVDLIVTQKVSNVSSDADEIAFVVRMLAAQKHPVGVYFISEDIYSLASYYRHDLRDLNMFPYGFEPLPDDELDIPMVYLGERTKLPLAGDDAATGNDLIEAADEMDPVGTKEDQAGGKPPDDGEMGGRANA